MGNLFLLFGDAFHALTGWMHTFVQTAAHIFADTSNWSELEQRLQNVGTSTNQLVHLCQNYWYIPMAFALIVVAVLIVAGGREGRVKAKSALWWAFVSMFVIFSIPSIISLFSSLIGTSANDLTKLGGN